MKFPSGVVAIAVAPMAAMAFMQPGSLRPSVRTSTTADLNNVNSKFGTRQNKAENKAMSELKMAFNLKEGETSNMFDGPTPLVKERDACGVGFIANTKNGGKKVMLVDDHSVTFEICTIVI